MKYLYTLVALLFLASCTAQNAEEMDKTISEVDTATEKTTEEMDIEISNIEISEDVKVEEEEMETKVVKLDATYTNPKTEVDMVIDYTLDSEDKIETINVTATTYDLSDFDKAVQVVVGKTLEEASEASIAGWSLTNAAFKSAIK